MVAAWWRLHEGCMKAAWWLHEGSMVAASLLNRCSGGCSFLLEVPQHGHKELLSTNQAAENAAGKHSVSTNVRSRMHSFIHSFIHSFVLILAGTGFNLASAYPNEQQIIAWFCLVQPDGGRTWKTATEI